MCLWVVRSIEHECNIIECTENAGAVYFTCHSPFHCPTSIGMCMPKVLKLASICSVFLLFIQIKSTLKIENDAVIGNKYSCSVPQACMWLNLENMVFSFNQPRDYLVDLLSSKKKAIDWKSPCESVYCFSMDLLYTSNFNSNLPWLAIFFQLQGVRWISTCSGLQQSCRQHRAKLLSFWRGPFPRDL